jgi:hypothetical protein
MRNFRFLILLALLAAGGCAPEKPDSGVKAPAGPVKPPAPIAAIHEIDIGDAETSIFIEGRLSEDAAAAAGIAAEDMETPKGDLVLTTITVTGAPPAALPVTFTLRSRRDFPGRPVAVRARVLRETGKGGEKEELLAFGDVLGGDASLRKQAGGELPPQRVNTVDAIAGLAELPDTMLLVAEADLLLLAEGTPEHLVDYQTAEAPSGDRITILSNPVRIHFESAADPS